LTKNLTALIVLLQIEFEKRTRPILKPICYRAR